MNHAVAVLATVAWSTSVNGRWRDWERRKFAGCVHAWCRRGAACLRAAERGRRAAAKLRWALSGSTATAAVSLPSVRAGTAPVGGVLWAASFALPRVCDTLDAVPGASSASEGPQKSTLRAADRTQSANCDSRSLTVSLIPDRSRDGRAGVVVRTGRRGRVSDAVANVCVSADACTVCTPHRSSHGCPRSDGYRKEA